MQLGLNNTHSSALTLPQAVATTLLRKLDSNSALPFVAMAVVQLVLLYLLLLLLLALIRASTTTTPIATRHHSAIVIIVTETETEPLDLKRKSFATEDSWGPVSQHRN